MNFSFYRGTYISVKAIYKVPWSLGSHKHCMLYMPSHTVRGKKRKQQLYQIDMIMDVISYHTKQEKHR